MRLSCCWCAAWIPTGDHEDRVACGSVPLHVLPGAGRGLPAFLRMQTTQEQQDAPAPAGVLRPGGSGEGDRSPPADRRRRGRRRSDWSGRRLRWRAPRLRSRRAGRRRPRDARSRTTSRPPASSMPPGARPRDRACRAGRSDTAALRVGSSAGSQATDTSRGRSHAAARSAAPAAPGRAVARSQTPPCRSPRCRRSGGTVPAGAVRLDSSVRDRRRSRPRGPLSARASPSCATLTQTPAARRDACAVIRPIFTAAGARGPHRSVWSNRPRSAAAGDRHVDGPHQPSANRSGPSRR